MTWERIKDATQNGREAFSSGVASLVGKVEEATGLKLRETLGWRERVVAAESKAMRQAEEAVDAVGGVVAGSTKEVKAAVNVETKKFV